ncbi:peptide-methionine (S)-S-oxide reductase MsrA [Demequina mangrovi]|uniref:Peptide methionine sulfoxide reductase MsrA n=1 Tax=Demequina mangrovi TaxID=1043493 RepID=A0A1H6YEG6_9MICO|nr:peptide-methionine (S)-S-oxide reductase MsrA [Demequina mangrovi]SEJ35580.1 peptide-methionine (S)-S-oxide reductase [Demequina mangrovi]
MLGIDKTVMVNADKALTGRDAEMQIAERHVVLGTSLKGPWPEGSEVLYVGMGCFWGAERIFWQLPGVHVTAVGYMGGWTRNPNYQETCTSLTGHTETVQVVYDPAAVDLATLLAAFWENHDPTTPNRQGGDIGTQYRSAIFATTDAQLAAAEASRERYQARLTEQGYGAITTQIARADEAGDGTFYYAEDYHQGYLHKNPDGYCNHGFCQVSFA